ncbi:MAG: hypothetical protein ACOYMB_03435 [Patescibacteria group bacterium]
MILILITNKGSCELQKVSREVADDGGRIIAVDKTFLPEDTAKISNYNAC